MGEASSSVMFNFSHRCQGKRSKMVNEVVSVCGQRALETFNLNSSAWGFSAHGLHGPTVMSIACSALLDNGDKLLHVVDPLDGSSASSSRVEATEYHISVENGQVDYDEVEALVRSVRPKLLAAPLSVGSRLTDCGRLRRLADSVGALLLVDLAHLSGLVASGAVASPFHAADVVTASSHGTLGGPHGTMIFARKGHRSFDRRGNALVHDIEERLSKSSLRQGFAGYIQTMASVGVAFNRARTKEFKLYTEQTCANAQALASSLLARGIPVVTGGTDTDRLWLDLRAGVTANTAEALCAEASLLVRPIAAAGHHGLSVSTAAMTSRGMDAEDFHRIGDFLATAVDISREMSSHDGGDPSHFDVACLESPPGRLLELKAEVENLAERFEMVG